MHLEHFVGKQKSLHGDALSLQCYYQKFEMGKQKSPSGIPPGLFCFPKFIQTINDLIFISQWVIDINTDGNGIFLLTHSLPMFLKDEF